MKVKFNKFERVAGLFVMAAFLGGFAFMVSVAVKQGWFESKSMYTTLFTSADGIHPGTTVQMAGLKAGSVEQVELLANNQIHVRFYVFERFENKIRENSQAQLIRPFLIGERVLDVTVGEEELPKLKPGSSIASHETIDLMTLMSGRKLGNYLEGLSSGLGNLRTLAEAFLDKDRTTAFINAFDRIDPLLKNLNTMSIEVIKLSKQATKDENLGTVMGQLAVTTSELNKMLPDLSKKAPEMAKNVESLIRNMAILTEEFKVLIPALAEVAPELPAASRRAVEALDEAVVLIKAMQKSFFVRGSVEDVQREEAQEIKSGKRKPANQK